MRSVRELEREVQRLRGELEALRLEEEIAARFRERAARHEPRGNLSAYCIGASIGAGARHEQCPGVYHGRACTCDCGHPGY